MASPFDFSTFLLTPPIPDTDSSNSQRGSQLRPPSAYPTSFPGTGPSDHDAPTGADSTTFRRPTSNDGDIAIPPVSPRRDQHFTSFTANDRQPSETMPRNPSDQGATSGALQQSSNQQQQQTTQPLPNATGSLSQASMAASSSKLPSLDERDYGLDPSAFGSVRFQMPSFLTASADPAQFGGEGIPNMVDPQAFLSQQPLNVYQPPSLTQVSTMQNTSLSGTSAQSYLPPQLQMPAELQQQLQRNTGKTSSNKPQYTPDTSNPVYGIYGSSVISVYPDLAPFKTQLNKAQPMSNPTQVEESRGTTPDFDPKSLGLPIGNNLFPQPLPGLYSTSGFDMLGVLARVVARPNPQINIGPVDTSCSFLVVDARRYDMPIVFASSTFTELTGYSNAEIIGRNCRFLQAPDGHVAMGSRRKYTDGNAVYHLKTHIQSGKESQASIINYRKDGSPFINLVTVVPITWDTDEIAYFVGFQVDLVEQPNAILEKMRNGTYVVNYSLLPTSQAPIPTAPVVPAPTHPPEETLPMDESYWSEQKPVKIVNPVASNAATVAAAQSTMTIAPELLEVMGAVEHGDGDGLDDDAAKKKWNKMLLDHTGDVVHVLSLKGSFLYVSPSVKGMLEYEPSELIGKTLQSVCHPSDIVPVMRELKESSTVAHPIINLLYRFRRKHSGYIWLEAQGKLYLEQSKSRKCVILVGRERPVYKISWNDLRSAGGLGEKEFWSKISPDGMFLYATASIKTVLGLDADNIRGSSMFELVEPDKAAELTKALADAAGGTSVRLHHKLRGVAGNLVDVITNFFPNSQPKGATPRTTAGVVYPSIIAQTNEYSSEMRRRATMNRPLALPMPQGIASPNRERPALLRVGTGSGAAVRDMIVTTPDIHSDDSGSPREGSANGSGTNSGTDSSAPSTFSAIPSTYKSLIQQVNPHSDNVFDELDTIRTTSWQYELHQLKLTNKKLKEELHMLQAAKRKRKKKEELEKTGAGEISPASSGHGTAGAATTSVKQCANCGRQDSPEWRVGPSGQRNLCNACGLRWAKATRIQRQSSATPSSTPSSGGTSDIDTATSYLQPGGPFAISRPPLQHAESSRFNIGH